MISSGRNADNYLFLFQFGVCSEWGRLRNLCPWEAVRTWLYRDWNNLAEVNSALSGQWNEVTFRGFFKPCYSMIRRSHLILCKNIYQVCVTFLVVSNPVCATSRSHVFLLFCSPSSVGNIVNWSWGDHGGNCWCFILTMCQLLLCRSQFSCPL